MKKLQLGITLLFFWMLNSSSVAQDLISEDKLVTTSSIDGAYSESYINDGSTEFDKESDSGLTKTMGGQYQWIQFDLGSKYQLSKVIFNCPATVESDLGYVVNNDDLIIVVSDDPDFKGVYNSSEIMGVNSQKLAWTRLSTYRRGINTTTINSKMEGRYVRIWDTYIGGITATEIEVYGKVSATAAKEAVSSGDTQATIDLLEAGGSVDSEQALKLAIDKKDKNLITAVLNKDRAVPASVLVHAFNKNASSSMMSALLSGEVEVTSAVADAAVRSKNESYITKLLTKDASGFETKHVEQAFALGQADIGMKILDRAKLQPSKKMLETAISKGDMVLAGELINDYGAKPDTGMLNTSIRDNNTSLINLLSSKVRPNSETFQIIARNGDHEMFQEFTAESSLPDNRAIEIAIDKGNTKILKTGLKNGGKVNPALDYAVSKSNPEMVDYLIDQKGADANKAIDYAVKSSNKILLNKILNEKDGDASAALSSAITHKKTDLAIMAMETGKTDPSKYLAPAVVEGNVELAKAIVDNGGDPNPGLLPAVQADNVGLVEHFLAYDASVEDAKLMEVAAKDKKMAIVKMLVEKGAIADNGVQNASAAGRLDVVVFLLESGADPDRGVNEAAAAGHADVLQALLDIGGTADKGMESAVNGNHTKCVIMLLEADADATVASYIATASGKNNLEMVKALVGKGADVENGLEAAIGVDAVKTLQYLEEEGGDLNKAEYMKIAVSKVSIGAVNMIAEAGVDVNEKVYDQGHSYLHQAIAVSNNPNLCSALIKAGAEVKSVDNANDTPLHYAARRGKDKAYLKVAELLLEAGAEINPKNNSGNTPRRVAKGRKMKKLLKDAGGEK